MKLISANNMRYYAQILGAIIPKGYGFTLIVFPFRRPGISNYISNAKREDMIKALEEKLEQLKNKSDFHTPEDN